MVITTFDMEVKQLIESSLCAMSGYDHAVDIGLFSAVVKADLHQEKDKDKSLKYRFWDVNKRPMSLRNEVYSQLRSFVDVNSGADLNSYSLLDEWSLLKNKHVIVYTFDEIKMNFKVEYTTMAPSRSVIEILKTSIGDIVISYHAISDKNALLKKLRALYNYKEGPISGTHYVLLCTTCQETCTQYTCSCYSHISDDIREQDREKVYRDLKDLESIHISPNWNWETRVVILLPIIV